MTGLRLRPPTPEEIEAARAAIEADEVSEDFPEGDSFVDELAAMRARTTARRYLRSLEQQRAARASR